jgi:hypothetical protein
MDRRSRASSSPDGLRALYAGVDIYCIPIYSDSFGHADDIFVDLGQLVWLNAIYDVDLTTHAYDTGSITDLEAIAQSIMDVHDMQYAPPIPAMSSLGAAFLVTAVLGVGGVEHPPGDGRIAIPDHRRSRSVSAREQRVRFSL